MNQPRTCGRCGKELTDASPGSLCTRCMFRDGLITIENAAPSDEQPATDLPAVGANGFAANGRSFGDYELLEEIARGGMGVVYKGRQKSLDRLVAIKIILVQPQADATLTERLTREAKAIASLQHPNIVGVHEVGQFGDRQYLTMDYVEGSNLHELCAKEPLEPARAARYVKTIAEAIHYAHQQGVLHRDLKPSNVLVDQLDQPRITDFGLAKSLATDAHLTLSGQTLGTPQYMPPEQASIHHGQAGPWSDVYSIGGILYHLLTGRPPFVAGQVGDVLEQVLESDPVAPRVLNPSVPRDLETICLKCLEKDPRRRYATADALAEELGRYLENKPILARPASRAEKMWRWCRRRPLIAALWLALVLALVTGVGGVLWQWQRAQAGELTARQNAYDSDMILAQQALAEGDLGHARALLDRQRPLDDQVDLRGWEWRYRWQQCQKGPAWRRSLFQHTHAAQDVVVSADGKWLAVSAVDGTVATLDLASGPPQILQSASGAPAVVAIAPKGDLLAFTQCEGYYRYSAVRTILERGRIKLWDVAAARETHTTEYDGRIVALDFSPDGRYLVALAVDRTWTDQKVIVWNVAEPTLVTSTVVAATGSNGNEDSLAISPDGDVLAVGDATGRVHVLSLPECDSRLIFPAHDEMVTALAFSSDGRILASGAGYSDPSVRLWNPTTGKAVAPPLAGHKRFVQALTFSPDGKVLASASADQSIRLWVATTGREIGVLRGHSQEVLGLAYLPDGSGLISASKDGSVWLWNTKAPPAPVETGSTAAGVWQFAFLPDSRSGAAVTADGSIDLRNLVDLRVQESFEGLGSGNWMVAPSPDGRLLAAGTSGGQVKIWDMRQRRVLEKLQVASKTAVVYVEFTSSGRQLVTAGLDPMCPVTRWDVATWTRKGTWQFGEIPVTGDFSSSGRFAVAGLNDGTLAVLDCDSNRRTLLRGQTGAITGAVYSPDETILATGSDQGTLMLWSTKTWRPLGPPLRGHRMPIYRVAFSPDGRRIATSGSSGEEAVILWDVPTRRPVATLEGKGSNFNWVSFSPDGNTIAAVARDVGTLHLWRAPSWPEILAGATEQDEDFAAR